MFVARRQIRGDQARQSAKIGARLRVEPLEGRALLSAIEGAGLAPGGLVTIQSDHHNPLSTHQPLVEHVGIGIAVKHPHFYPVYQGPRLDSLNGIAATGHLIPGVGFQFTGTVVGQIDPTFPALYVFGVNRGGAAAPGPFPQRTDIFFDSAVVVRTGPAGVSGQVVLFDAKGNPTSVTPLDPASIFISGNTVGVTVNPFLLPPTSKAGTRFKFGEYRFSFWPRIPGGGPENIASFVPEYSIANIAVFRHYPHRGE